jgi:hypothetical protein
MRKIPDLRKHVRYLCAAIAEIRITTGDGAGASYVALVTDICVKGMRLSMDGPIEVGTQVVVPMPGQIDFVGTVRHVRPDGREYTVGIEFTVGEWNQCSDWPQHRSLPGQEHGVCTECSHDSCHTDLALICQ